MPNASLIPRDAGSTHPTVPASNRLFQVYDLPSKGRRIPAMEGIRGLAVLLVFMVHYDQLIANLLPTRSSSRVAFDWCGQVGHAGVDLFFLLSGYLIYGLIRSGKRSIPDFLVRRARRIYPTFLVVMACYVFYMLAVPVQSKIPSGVGHATAYLAENVILLPGIVSIPPMITVAWSLSYEVFFYGLLPVMYMVFRIRYWNRTARMCFFTILAIAYSGFCLTHWTSTISGFPLRPGQHVRLTMFIAGILVFELVSAKDRHFWISRRCEGVIAALATITVVLIPALPSGTSPAIPALMLFGAFGATCASALINEQGPIATGLSFMPLRCLGNMSYSYYLAHAVFIHLGRSLVFHFVHVTEVVVWLALPLCFVLAWLGSTLLFVTVEKPLSLG